MTCIRVMIVGTSEDQLEQLGRSIGDVLIAPSAGPDHSGGEDGHARLIQFGRVAVDQTVAMHLYVVSGNRRFTFMCDVLGRDMDACLVLVDPNSEESRAGAQDVLGAVADSGITAVAVGAGGEAARSPDLAQRLGAGNGVPTLACECGDREAVKRALCAVLQMVPSRQSAPGAGTRPETGVAVPVGIL